MTADDNAADGHGGDGRARVGQRVARGPVMRRWVIVTVTVMTASLWAIPAQAQSLADVARREAERRKAIKSESTRVFTNEDLRPVPGSTSVTPKGAPPPATATDALGPGDVGVADELDSTRDEQQVPVKAREKRDEQYWRGRTADYDQRLSRMRDDIAAMQGRLSTINAKLDAARGDTARRVLQRERAEVTSVLSGFQQNLGFLHSEYNHHKERAASKDIEPDWVR